MKKIAACIAALTSLLMSLTVMQTNAVWISEEQAAVSAAASGKLTVSEKQANPGEDVELTVSLSDNPGIIAMRFWVSYDADVLELVKAEDGKLFTAKGGDQTVFTPSLDTAKGAYSLMWEAMATENYTESGTVAVLHFHVADSAAAGTYRIKVEVDDESIIDCDLNDVPFTATDGAVIIGGKETTTTNKATTTQPTTTKATTTQSTTIEATTTTTVKATTTTTTQPTTTVKATTTTTTQPTTTTVKATTTHPTTTKATIINVETSTETTITNMETITESTTTSETTTEAPATTATSTTEATTTTETTTTEAATTTVSETLKPEGYYASPDRLCEMAVKDYQIKHENADVTAKVIENAEGKISIQIMNADGEVIDTYQLDAATGIGSDSNGDVVDLPATGITSRRTAVATGSAVALIAVGAWLAGTAHRKKKEQ